METSTSVRTGIEPFCLLNASWVDVDPIVLRKARAFCRSLAFLATTKVSTTATNWLSVPG